MPQKIERLQHPTLKDFERAAEVSATRWQALGELNSAERFEFLRRIGVELVVAADGGRWTAVCFAWPVSYRVGGESFSGVWLFQLASLPGSGNGGVMMIYHMMEWYPSILCVGVTEQSAKIFAALRWKRFDGVSRCVHPVDLGAVVEHYGDRFKEPWKLRLLKALALVYNPVMLLLETLAGLGVPGRVLAEGSETPPPGLEPVQYPPALRLGMMAGYLDIRRMGAGAEGLTCVDFAGVGRIVEDGGRGLSRLRRHARAWRALRARKAALCEIMATSPEQVARSRRMGYVPLPMPVYYWENTQPLDGFFERFEETGFSFLTTDKLL